MFQAEKNLSREDRKILERTIPRIGSTILKSGIEIPNTEDGLLKYPQLARLLFKQWISGTKRSTSQDFFPNRDREGLTDADRSLNLLHDREHNISKGFTVTGQIMGMTVAAYKKYRTTGRSVEELVKMQMNPETIAKSVLWIAMRPNEANEEIEDALCIYDSSYDLAVHFGDVTFKVYDRDAEPPYFIPDLIRLRQLVSNDNLTAEGDYCPATYFIPKLWGEMIDIAAADSRFYETDLGLVN